MKIIAYDVIDYEKPIFEKIIKEQKIEIIMIEESLSVDNINMAKGCDGISVIGYSRVTKEILDEVNKLGIKHLSTRTIGFEHIDTNYAKKLGIHISNARYQPNNVADFTVMMMLILLRKAKISICRALVNDFSLDGLMGREMRNLTVGVVGTGKIGATVIKNLSGFGCKILAVDKFENESVKDIAAYTDFDTLCRESDIITLHVPMTDENYHMINEKTIAKMKKGVIIINTARGALIDTESLIEGLEKEWIGGAGIDTIEEESGIVHVHVGTKIVEKRSLLYLKQFPNVLFTQHYAFYTEEASESMVRCGIDSICLGITGKENPYEIV